ncbi:MAG TPA: hypothetical protein VHS78_03330 [Candidatus Elarobacter sp.]|nr:hypothetical protein [Candidatus Elarobacter sp.]
MSAARRAGARIAVAGVSAASPVARELVRAELDGVRVVGLDAESDGDGVDRALRESDMLVFLADSREIADPSATERLASAAHERGLLVAALLVGTDGGGSELLAAVREAADMVMVVRDRDDARAVIAALR